MPISVACACSKKFNVKDDLAGKKIKCPGCQAVLEVPAANAVTSASAPPQPVMAAVIEDDEPRPAVVARKTARVEADDGFDERPRRRDDKARKKNEQKGSKTLLYVLVGGGIVLLGLCCTGVGVGGYLLFQLGRDKKLTVPAEESDTWLGATKTMSHRKGNLHYRAYRIDLKAGRTYIIDLKRNGSTASTPYLILEDNNGKMLREDEFTGGFGNPRIVFTPMTDGEYRILATTVAGLGPFTLSVKEAGAGIKDKKDTPDPQDKKDKVLPGKILEDRNRWSPTDPKITIASPFKDGPRKLSAPYKSHKVLLKAGKAYIIDLVRHVADANNPQPDPYLIVQNANGMTLAENDDVGDGILDARLVFVPRQDGEYRIIAATINGYGEYTLTVKEQ
jgi:hypothetical protein